MGSTGLDVLEIPKENGQCLFSYQKSMIEDCSFLIADDGWDPSRWSMNMAYFSVFAHAHCRNALGSVAPNVMQRLGKLIICVSQSLHYDSILVGHVHD